MSPSQASTAGQEAQHAGDVVEEAADQDVDMADDGAVDMVATRSAVLAGPTVLSESTKSNTRPDSGDSESVPFSMQLDDMG